MPTHSITIKQINMNTNTLPQDNFTNDIHAGESPNVPVRYLTTSSIIGDKVYDEKNAHLGHIKEIMMDVYTGKIHYCVLEFGGILGIGAKYFAIPYDLLRIDPSNKRFIFTGSKEILEKAPGFNHWHWPDTNYHLVEDAWSMV
jgi:sporulation protein YlmC with PRC-barrel domain